MMKRIILLALLFMLAFPATAVEARLRGLKESPGANEDVSEEAVSSRGAYDGESDSSKGPTVAEPSVPDKCDMSGNTTMQYTVTVKKEVLDWGETLEYRVVDLNNCSEPFHIRIIDGRVVEALTKISKAKKASVDGTGEVSMDKESEEEDVEIQSMFGDDDGMVTLYEAEDMWGQGKEQFAGIIQAGFAGNKQIKRDMFTNALNAIPRILGALSTLAAATKYKDGPSKLGKGFTKIQFEGKGKGFGGKFASDITMISPSEFYGGGTRYSVPVGAILNAMNGLYKAQNNWNN